jgi:hypothetical protein
LLAVVLVALMWRQEIPERERVPALVLYGAILLLVTTVGTIGRLSFGGSPPGTELLVRQETAPEVRALFRELEIAAMADNSRVLAYGPSTPIEVRWYGRYIPQVEASQATSSRVTRSDPFAFRPAPAPEPGKSTPTAGRTPWTTISQLNRSDLHPLGILRWMVSRHGLVEGRAQDIIVAQ